MSLDEDFHAIVDGTVLSSPVEFFYGQKLRDTVEKRKREPALDGGARLTNKLSGSEAAKIRTLHKRASASITAVRALAGNCDDQRLCKGEQKWRTHCTRLVQEIGRIEIDRTRT